MFCDACRIDDMRAVIGLPITIALLLLFCGGGYCLMLKGRYVDFLGNNKFGSEQPNNCFVGPSELAYGHICGQVVTVFFDPLF